MEAANGKACLPLKARKRHAAGRAIQRRRNPVPNRRQFVFQAAAVLLAFGLIPGLLPGFAATPDLSTQAARTARAGAIVPLDGPVLAGKPVTFKLSGNPVSPLAEITFVLLPVYERTIADGVKNAKPSLLEFC